MISFTEDKQYLIYNEDSYIHKEAIKGIRKEIRILPGIYCRSGINIPTHYIHNIILTLVNSEVDINVSEEYNYEEIYDKIIKWWRNLD